MKVLVIPEDFRAEVDPKELYFDPLAEQRGLHKEPDGKYWPKKQPVGMTECDNFVQKTSKA